MKDKKTKIVCTIGPASESPEILEKMIQAGMNVARLNFSHGSYPSHAKLIKNIRIAAKKLNTSIAIMQDLQGPKIRVGEMPEAGIMLKDGQHLTLTTRAIKGTAEVIPVQYKHLPKDVNSGDRILICDGLIDLKVESVKGQDIECKVIIGGLVKSHKGINVPTASISANPITDKDKKDLEFGLKNDVDYIALSFVKTAANIAELRELIREKHGQAKIIAKIERHEAIENIEEIIHEADGIMVARGDMGVEIPPEHVPLVQKRINKMANLHGKPVIIATEMLQSMIENPRPTRAEVSDVANAVFDHTDAIMLSNESAVGKYPVQAVQLLSRIAISIESELKRHQKYRNNQPFIEDVPLSFATCSSAAHMASEIEARLIVATTVSGFTAQELAKHRIYVPIVAITEDPKVVNQLQLVWGINHIFLKKISDRNRLSQIKKLILDAKLAHHGDEVVVVSNASQNIKDICTIVI